MRSIQQLADALHRIEQLRGPALQRNAAPVTLECEPRLAAASRYQQMIALDLFLLVGADRRAVLEQQQQQQGLEEIELAQIDPDRVKGAVIERSHLYVFNAGS